MRENDKALVTVHEIANNCGVRRSAILQRIATLKKHRNEIENFLNAKHQKNHKLYFDKFIAKLIENTFNYKKRKSVDSKNSIMLLKSKNKTIKDLETNNDFLRNQNYYLTHYKN